MENKMQNKMENEVDNQFYHRNKHKLFILPRFQFKIVSLTLWTALGVFGITFLSYKLIFQDQIMKLIEISDLTELSKKAFLHELNLNLVYLLLVCLLFSLLMIGTSIYFSHKLAGPIYQINKILIQFLNGNSEARLHFRKGDELMFLEDRINFVLDQAALAKTKEINNDKNIKIG